MVLSCSAQNKQEKKSTILVGTKWEWKLDSQCVNYLQFINNNIYEEYNCELGEKWKGTYKFNKDTLFLKEDIYTSDVPGQGESLTNQYKMIFTSKGLTVVYSKTFQDGIWQERWIKNPKIFFKKVN